MTVGTDASALSAFTNGAACLEADCAPIRAVPLPTRASQPEHAGCTRHRPADAAGNRSLGLCGTGCQTGDLPTDPTAPAPAPAPAPATATATVTAAAVTARAIARGGGAELQDALCI